MAIHFNPLEHPVCLQVPERIENSCWVEHLPFAMWLTSAMKPRILVELGTYGGASYCGFCQAIAWLGLPTRSFAVDTWKGDPHNGWNGPHILENLRSHHDARYVEFSQLLELTFDEAAFRFADGEIDLLHIDGYHTYEAVKHDYETWRPRMSDRGVILFHDVAVTRGDFGVWKLWEQLVQQYPSFTFEHEHGLGVLAVGPRMADDVRALVDLRGEAADSVRSFFHQLGKRSRFQDILDSTLVELREARSGIEDHKSLMSQAREELERERGLRIGIEQEIISLVSQAREELERERGLRIGIEQEIILNKIELGRERDLRLGLQQENVTLQSRADDLRNGIAAQELAIADLQSSVSYRLVKRLSSMTGQLAPLGSKSRWILSRLARGAEVFRREGSLTAARKLTQKAGSLIPKTRSISGHRLDGWRADHRPVFLLIHHDAGGGTARHVRDLGHGLLAEGIRPVFLRPRGRDGIHWEELDEAGNTLWSHTTTTDPDTFRLQMELLAPIHVHVHHLMELPHWLVGRAPGSRCILRLDRARLLSGLPSRSFQSRRSKILW